MPAPCSPRRPWPGPRRPLETALRQLRRALERFQDFAWDWEDGARPPGLIERWGAERVASVRVGPRQWTLVTRLPFTWRRGSALGETSAALRLGGLRWTRGGWERRGAGWRVSLPADRRRRQDLTLELRITPAALARALGLPRDSLTPARAAAALRARLRAS